MYRLPLLLALIFCTCVPALNHAQQNLNQDHWKALAPRPIGPAGMSGRITAIDVHPLDKDKIYVGSASGGVWISENGGTSFEPVFDDQKYMSIGALAISDANPNIVWAGTGEGNPRNSANYGGGIYKSLDGGKTWAMMGLEKTKAIYRILPHPTDPETVYVGALGNMWAPNPERGVYRTTDGGKNWDKVLYIDEGTGIAEMVMDPTNPDKLIAATWTFDRDPDYFNSGGPGSGIWITTDGGDNWTRRTAKDGLPKGNLGRIGLAIAASKPDIVYALVEETGDNGLYKSTNGGETFSLVTKKDVGDRPFYYAEIYVDPQNENRVFHISTYVSRSEDGGKTFNEIANYGNSVHPDHHSFWIDKDNPEYVIDGNDGGLNISHDGGDTWRFAQNIPVGQFYHVAYDMSYPYLVGGGMQDNGSWVGPSQGLKSGGITDADWQEVFFGDGFDMIFKPGAPDMVYAASQGGYLGTVHRPTGKTTFIRPVHPDGEFLRFNWNAPIAQSPTDVNAIYMGSQYVHKTTDGGMHWEIISPDLTTNDTSLQRSDRSGGLTIDATQAENHTTLLTIVPERPTGVGDSVIWVGSDDGRLHLTRNGGGSWTDLSAKLPGMTPGSWIGYIESSPINLGEAFVVVNDYRRGDTRPVVYHTSNYGSTFTQIVDDGKVSGHAQAIVQDPVQENLLFLGTDQGLWYSLDYGSSWTRFDADYPHVSTIDLKIHPREHDLIVGTFGRAIYIMDDIRPFREMAKRGTEMLQDSFAVFPAPNAYQYEYRSYQGTRFYAQGQFQGKDRPDGALLTYWVRPGGPSERASTDPDSIDLSQLTKFSMIAPEIKEDIPARETGSAVKAYANQDDEIETIDPPKEKVKFQIIDVQSGDTIRTYTEKPQWGMNRTTWNMRRDGMNYPSRREVKDDADIPSGMPVVPGTYRILMTYGDHSGETMVTVAADPRDPTSRSARYVARDRMMTEFEAKVTEVKTAFDRLQDARKSLKRVADLSADSPKAVKDTLANRNKVLTKQIDSLEVIFTEAENLKGIQRNPTNLQSKLFGARSYIGQIEGEPSQMAELTLGQFQVAADDFIGQVEAFFAGDFARFEEEVGEVELSPFKE